MILQTNLKHIATVEEHSEVLKNNENEDEIGYRLREKHWRKGFGTEISKGLIKFGFEKLKMEKITADVDTKNLNSAKILEKFMTQTKEFFNKSDINFYNNC